MQAQPTSASWSKAAKARQPGIYWRRKNSRTEYGFLRPLGNVEFSGTTLQSAIDARAAALLRHSAGQPAPNTKLRMRDLIEELRESKRPRLKPSSFAGLEQALDKVIGPELGHLRPVQVTAARIERLVRELEQRLAPATVTRYLSPMNELLNRAVQHGCIPTNPWTTLAADQRPRTGTQRKRFEWSPEDIGALLSASRALDKRPAARQRYYALIALLALTGCRVGEALALRWTDVDIFEGTISIRHSWSRTGELTTPKTAAGARTIPIPDALLRILLDHKPLHARGDDWCFPARHGDGPVAYWNFRDRGFAEARKQAGLEGCITIHDLRHCAASLLIAAGISDVDVAAQLGHANANVTRAIYAHVYDQRVSAAKIREAFDGLASTDRADVI